MMVDVEERATADEALAGYRMTELGLLPEDWQTASIGVLVGRGVLSLKNGFAQGGHNSEGRGVPHLRPFNVTSNGTISLDQVKSVSPPVPSSPYWVLPGDVIFNNTNSEELVGKTAFFPLEGRYVLSNHMTIMRVHDPSRLDAYWLSQYLQLLWRQGVLQSLCRRHVNQASVSLERLKEVHIPLPPLPEQRAIAHVLSTVQRAREATEAVIAATRELKRSLMRHLFMYGPVPVDEVAGVRLKETEIGLVPEGWGVRALSSVAAVQGGCGAGEESIWADDGASSLPSRSKCTRWFPRSIRDQGHRSAD